MKNILVRSLLLSLLCFSTSTFARELPMNFVFTSDVNTGEAVLNIIDPNTDEEIARLRRVEKISLREFKSPSEHPLKGFEFLSPRNFSKGMISLQKKVFIPDQSRYVEYKKSYNAFAYDLFWKGSVLNASLHVLTIVSDEPIPNEKSIAFEGNQLFRTLNKNKRIYFTTFYSDTCTEAQRKFNICLRFLEKSARYLHYAYQNRQIIGGQKFSEDTLATIQFMNTDIENQFTEFFLNALKDFVENFGQRFVDGMADSLFKKP